MSESSAPPLPIRRASGPVIVAAVLAAGGSRRMGSPKQLLAIQGEPLVRRIVTIVCASECREVAVVLGAQADAVRAAIGNTRAHFLLNEAWSAGGLASSLHCAVQWAREQSAAALLLVACDQPYLSLSHLDALCSTYRRNKRTAASVYDQQVGMPALIDAGLFDTLLTIRGDRGAASVLRSEPNVERIAWPEGALHLDTPADVARYRQEVED